MGLLQTSNVYRLECLQMMYLINMHNNYACICICFCNTECMCLCVCVSVFVSEQCTRTCKAYHIYVFVTLSVFFMKSIMYLLYMSVSKLRPNDCRYILSSPAKPSHNQQQSLGLELVIVLFCCQNIVTMSNPPTHTHTHVYTHVPHP